MRCFNTAGPCDPRFHYMLPAAERLPEAPRLVAQGAYFVVHAPRQTGKTTTLRALAQALTAQGRYAALHVTCEIGEIGEDDYQAVQRTLLRTIQREATAMLPAELQPPVSWPGQDPLQLLSGASRRCVLAIRCVLAQRRGSRAAGHGQPVQHQGQVAAPRQLRRE